jgi:hypothetical protein
MRFGVTRPSSILDATIGMSRELIAAEAQRHTARRLGAFLLGFAVVAGCVVLVVATRGRRERWPEPVRAANAVGDSTCLSCHREKASFERTSHRATTRPAAREAILGSFRPGENVLRTVNPAVHFRMHADSSGFHQTAVVGTGADTTTRTERIGIVAGSGRRGQSYLYWIDDRLYQLPVSWWASLGTWINSPGPAYVEGRPNFDRAISPRCLECHATWIESVLDLGATNRYHPESAMLGITCERCHAAGQEHVRRERSILRFARGPAIVNPARLTRERQMEACAQCHGGLGTLKAPAFSYVAGARLDDYLHLPDQASDSTVDVHGNQATLLARSRCYQASQMTCLTCHDVHREQRDVTQLSGRCATCHQEQSCGLFPRYGHALAGRCVDCHMPVRESSLIVSGLEGKQERARIRSHWIRVYADKRDLATAADVGAGPAISPPGRPGTVPPMLAPR